MRILGFTQQSPTTLNKHKLVSIGFRMQQLAQCSRHRPITHRNLASVCKAWWKTLVNIAGCCALPPPFSSFCCNADMPMLVSRHLLLSIIMKLLLLLYFLLYKEPVNPKLFFVFNRGKLSYIIVNAVIYAIVSLFMT